jgi:phosphate transport system substrate-binding protein
VLALVVGARAAAVEPPGRVGAARAEAYAVIANPLVPSAGVSLDELREMFLGTRRSWGNGQRVVVLVQTPGSRTRAFLLREVYHMDEAAFKRYWIARTFRSEPGNAFAGGGGGGGPTLVSSDAMARRLTASIPGAVAVVAASEVDAGVRVLRVDGRLPGADGYPLAAAP